MTDLVSPDLAASLFTRSDGSYLCARWGRPIVPVVFGVEDRTLATVKGAIEAVVVLAGHRMAETDPELGANLMVFFLRDWAELTAAPGLDRLIPELGPLVARLEAAQANQYRIFRFDEAGAIRACFSFVRMDAEMQQVPAGDLALSLAAQSIVLWSDLAFRDQGPLGRLPSGLAVLRPEIGAVIRAVHDPALPDVARDPSHALRLAARANRMQ